MKKTQNESKAWAQTVEKMCYDQIVAPRGLIDPGCRPLSGVRIKSHHWYTFVKVYGSYLIAMAYQSSHLRKNLARTTAAKLMKVCRLVLQSRILKPEEFDAKLQAAIWDAAQAIDQDVSRTERSVYLHMLLFHMRRKIFEWGPTRSYHCFPFER